MKRYLLIMLGALFCAGAFTPPTTTAGVFIEIGDRPYYSPGPTATGRGIGKAGIDGIGCLDIGLGGIIIASGFTGITVIVKES